MSLNRYAAKRDANEPEIISALRDAGYVVYQLPKPVDLLITRKGKEYWALLEVKDKNGTLTDDQLEFFQLTEGCTRFIVRSPEEALRVCRVWVDRCADG